MKIKNYFLVSSLTLLLAPFTLFAQGPLDPSLLLKPATDAWPTYHGDYSGRHYSTLKQINASNVKGLTLAWIYRVNLGPTGAIIGGEGPESALAGGRGGEFGGPSIKAIPLMVNGVLYFAMPDHAFAVDARTGRQIWHFAWKTRGGIHIGNRGMGMYGNYLFFETPDNYVVSLDARHPQPCDHRHGRRLAGCPGLAGISRSGNRRDPVEMVHDATERGAWL
jgi:alcohol dehydrogenase (cytochrome c)